MQKRGAHGELPAALGGAGHLAESVDLGRRISIERELYQQHEQDVSGGDDTQTPACHHDAALGVTLSTISFDESGHFIVYGALSGIKVVNIVTNRVVRVLGSRESGERFVAVALYQGVPHVDTQFLLSRSGASSSSSSSSSSGGAASLLRGGGGGGESGSGSSSMMGKTADQIAHETSQPDPTIFCTR